VELLKQKEVGVGLKKRSGTQSLATSKDSPIDSPNGSPTPSRKPTLTDLSLAHYEVNLTAAERSQQHTVLAAKRKKTLEDWFLRGPHASVWSNVSPELRDILGLCLTADPEARVTPSELFGHPYFRYPHPPFAFKTNRITRDAN